MADTNITIVLSPDRVESLCNSYNCTEGNLEATLQTTLNGQADNYIIERVKEEEGKLDIATRKENLGSAFSITPSE